MKTKIFTVLTMFLMVLALQAQVDRSKQPTPGPAPKIALEVPGYFELPNGLKVLVVENHKLPRVSYSLTIDNKPIAEGDIAGVSSLLGSMLGNGTTSISKDDFNEEIDFLGARISFSSNGGYASALSKYSEKILELMADAVKNPLLSEEEFQKEKSKAIEGLKSSEKSVDAVAERIGNALAYGKHHPYGEFATEETVQKVTLKDVETFYRRYFTPKNAYLVVVGDVKFQTIQNQIKQYFSTWETMLDMSYKVQEAMPNAQYTQINFVDMPNAVQSNISLTSNVDLKMSDPDYHAVLIANKILGGGFNSYLNMNLREAHAYTYGARSSVGSDKYVSRFKAGASVRNAVTDSAVVETLKEIKRIKETPVTAEALANAKAKYVGDFVLALENPQTIARYALNIKVNDLPKDFYLTYLEKINAVTIADVKRVANKYFGTDNARIVIIGKGSEVLENLEKVTYNEKTVPIKYYDSKANLIEKPIFSKEIPANITVQSVLNNYINAVGGQDKIKSINTILTLANVTITGAPFKPTAVIKTMRPNKASMEMNIEGMGTIMKRKFNGNTGYTEQQGQQIPMTEKEITSQQAEKGLFPELFIDASTATLESIVAIEGNDAYKLKVTQNNDESFRYYDTTSGLLIRVEKIIEVQGQSITSIQDLSNYKTVSGVKIPFDQKLTSGPQIIILNSTEVKINEDVTDLDFN
ncbi:M16 family metallopeptidase [Algibacter miyuki]|uniref:M16 family metallopeptidase n=1 Tax=Algibacter miyuki TaxID=1306933 RepID=A0ABV5H1D0_9FLAO|nr:pitrilysin family protein [Algibacter miyuki]MDN3666213.1 pitrilysin family protein [Algibacter miyuki]